MAKKRNNAAKSGWVPHQVGYEYTESEHIIKSTINWLKEKRIFVTLLHKGYQSGGTFVLEYNGKKLLIDKPKDWPGTHKSIRVVFRNSARLWNHFTCGVLAATTDTLVLKFPRELFMLQRRAHFRVDLPDGCKASFMYNKKKCKLNMQDISVGGMLLCGSDRADNPEQGHTIHNITITIPPEISPSGEAEQTIRFKLAKGEVVRTFTNDKTSQLFLGVQFTPTGKEEEQIMKFVRQRELAILRKGLQE